jgi:hypothetical protein
MNTNVRKETLTMTITYHVGKHNGGYGYRLGDVWSETFSDHVTALAAAKSAAQRQHVEGRDAEISYQLSDGSGKLNTPAGVIARRQRY